MLLDGLITLLTSDEGLTSLVCAFGRNGEKPFVTKSVLPRDYRLPAIAIHRYGGTQDYDLAGPVQNQEDQVQVDIYTRDADAGEQVSQAVRGILVGYVGTLPDGTVVKACYLERDMNMPFQANGDTKGVAFRTLLGFRIVSV
jgi:hypothetical protein